jgi:hypothetical protein
MDENQKDIVEAGDEPQFATPGGLNREKVLETAEEDDEGALRIQYDNTLEEILAAMKLFHRRFGRTRRILMYIAYTIAIVLGVNMIVVNYTGWYGYVLAGMGVFFLSQQIYHPIMVRKRYGAALADMSEERLSATFRDEYIEINTLVINAEQTDKTYINLASEELSVQETDWCFLLYVNRRLMHLFPKRCLSDLQADRLREYFAGKGV